MLYEFQLGNNASVADCNICATVSEGSVADRTRCHWLKGFQDDISLEDYLRSERPPQCGV